VSRWPGRRKVVITAFGDESKLAIVESDLNDPAAGEVQLSVEYTIVSGSDVSMRRGTYPFQKKPPLTPGYSVIGNVRLNGPGSAEFAIGDCVACLSKYEGQSELINLPQQFLVRVPDAVDKKAAVVLILDGSPHIKCCTAQRMSTLARRSSFMR
jgi:synaptic vesicle membrane protein VAT-1